MVPATSSDFDLTEAQVIAQVEARVDQALAANRKREILIVVALMTLFLLGVGLIIWAASIRYWPLLVTGGLLELLVVFPIKGLIQLREDAIRLQVVPRMLRLAESDQGKRLAADFVEQLIER